MRKKAPAESLQRESGRRFAYSIILALRSSVMYVSSAASRLAAPGTKNVPPGMLADAMRMPLSCGLPPVSQRLHTFLLVEK